MQSTFLKESVCNIKVVGRTKTSEAFSPIITGADSMFSNTFWICGMHATHTGIYYNHSYFTFHSIELLEIFILLDLEIFGKKPGKLVEYLQKARDSLELLFGI